MYAFEKEKKKQVIYTIKYIISFIGSMNKYEVLDIVGKKNKNKNL